MAEFEFPSFPQPAEDARALLARLYREIGISAVAAALDLDHAGEARETLADLQEMVQSAHTRAA